MALVTGNSQPIEGVARKESTRMMALLRKDGDYVIYIAERRLNNDWIGVAHDLYGCPVGFSASGNCWQETGVHGTYDLQAAKKGIRELASKNPDVGFRVVKVTISQHKEPVWPKKAPS